MFSVIFISPKFYSVFFLKGKNVYRWVTGVFDRRLCCAKGDIFGHSAEGEL